MASVDLVSPFNKITIAGHSYTRDRGYAMEQELVANTDSLLDKNLAYFRNREAGGLIPLALINGTIVNDGRKLIMGSQPVAYLTRAEYALNDPYPPIDAVDFSTFFATQEPYNLRLTSALRMNATFPFILPVVRLPSTPYMNIMDAGLRDNFGAEVATRYLYVMRDWLTKKTGKVIFLEIRDTQEYDVASESTESSFTSMLFDPLFVIQQKWEVIQSYKHGFLKDYAPHFLNGKLHYVTLSYVPKASNRSAALNFHLTLKEKEDLYWSINNNENKQAIDTLLHLLR